MTKRKDDLNAAQLGQLREMKTQERFGRGRGGYTMLPHSYFSLLGRKVSGMAQFFIVGYVCDKTFGAQDAKGTYPQWCTLSLPVVARLTQMSAAGCWSALEDLVDRGLIERKEGTSGKTALYRTTPELWITIPDIDRKAKPRPGENGEQPEDTPPGDEDPVEAVGEPPGVSQEVQTGKAGKDVRLTIGIAGISDPVELRVRPRNYSGLPLVFQTSVATDGVVLVTARKGEEIANSAADIGRIKGERSSTAVDDKFGISVKSQRLADIRTALKPLLALIGPKPLDDGLLNLIATKLGTEASIEDFAALAGQEIAWMRRKRKPIASGILVTLAAQARQKWQEDAAERTAPGKTALTEDEKRELRRRAEALLAEDAAADAAARKGEKSHHA